MRQRVTLVAVIVAVGVIAVVEILRTNAVAQTQAATSAQAPYPVDRTVLPIREPVTRESTVLDAHQATPPPRFELKAPSGSPNVLIVLAPMPAHTPQTDGQ